MTRRSHEMADHDVGLLIQSYLDGEATPEQVEEVASRLADPPFRRQMAEQALDHAILYELAQEGGLSDLPSARSRSGGMRLTVRRWAMVGLAGGLVALLLGAWLAGLARDGTPDPLGVVSRIAGRVYVESSEQAGPIQDGVPLVVGAAIRVEGLSGMALMRFDDGTEVLMTGETQLRCLRERSKTVLVVHRGQLSATVAPRPKHRMLVVRTANAEMAVLGTRLVVSAEPDHCELAVREGRVRMKRLSDGRTIQVEAGQVAVASSRTHLEAQPWPETPDVWHADIQAGLPPDWRFGQWVEVDTNGEAGGAVRAARRFALDGHESNLYRVTPPKRWTRGLVEVHPDSWLHFRYKMERPGWLHVMFGARSSDLNPSHVGNFELQSSAWPDDQPHQWRTVSLPLSEFRRNADGRPYADLPKGGPRAGDIIYMLWFSTGPIDRGLTIDRIRIDRRF